MNVEKSDEGSFIPPAPKTVERSGILLSIELIDTGKRVREVNEAGAAQMADNILKNGLMTPLMVRPQLLSDPTQDMRYTLVLGGHRLAAVKMLGWTEVACDVRLLDDLQARSREIDENLIRHELDALDFGLFCAERKQLDERIAERAQHGGARHNSSGQVGHLHVPRFTAELADRIGRGERTIRRAITTVRALTPETIDLLRGTPVARVESKLIAIGRELNPIKQRSLAERLVAGDKTVQAARIALGDEEPVTEDPQETYYGQLCKAWQNADEKTQLRFLSLIDAAFIGTPKLPAMTPEMKRALGWENGAPKETASPAPSRGGRRSAKGTR